MDGCTQTDEGHFYSPLSPMSGELVVVVALLFYIHGNHLRDHVGTVSQPSHNFPGQA